MKKRFLALLLAMTMAMSVTAFARFDNEEFNYRKTTNVEAEAFGEQILVTWPAVDKCQSTCFNINLRQPYRRLDKSNKGYDYSVS